mmetsp:Transcript_567/g.817  ORF Transcript_567/g.817 Transcript_567/m.817 type:complete len:350 (-) Transcript_567:303-1352(-)
MPQFTDTLRALALHLEFGDLWKRVTNETTMQKTQRRAPDTCSQTDFISHMMGDMILRVAEYLEPAEICNMRRVSKALMMFIQANEKIIWRAPALRMAKELSYANQVNCANDSLEQQYLEGRLMWELAELRHYRSVAVLLEIGLSMPKGSMINIVANVGWFDNAALALAVSLRRYVALKAVMVSRSQDAVQFRQSSGYVGPLAFFSQDSISKIIHGNEALDRPSIPASTPGFVGYAVDLVRLDPKDEYMRYTFILSAYRNLSVWRTEEDMQRARRSGVLQPHVLTTVIPSAEVTCTWLREGRVGDLKLPFYIAFRRPRPSFTLVDQLYRHMKHLETQTVWYPNRSRPESA